jgi:LytR cell envelope-related transcriptional attenuator
MATTGTRRPFPAIAFLLILSLVAAIVWWRVLHRADQTGATQNTGSSSCARPTAGATAAALPAVGRVKVTVLNGNGRAGLAATVSKQLKARGFKSVAVGNDDPVSGVGEIRYAAAYAASATVLHAYFPGTILVLRASTPAGATVSLGSKYRALATASQVRAALVRASSAPAPTC